MLVVLVSFRHVFKKAVLKIKVSITVEMNPAPKELSVTPSSTFFMSHAATKSLDVVTKDPACYNEDPAQPN